jgi:hypothetical protein
MGGEVVMANEMISYAANGAAYTIPRDIYGIGNLSRSSANAKPPEMKKSFNLSELQAQHHEIARRLVIGQKPKEISVALGCSYQSIINIKNMPVVQEQINLLSGARDAEVVDIAKQIRDLAPKCVKVLENILDDEDAHDSLKLKASLSVLDRAGHSVPKNITTNVTHRIVSDHELALIKQRAAEIGIYEDVVEGEVES